MICAWCPDFDKTAESNRGASHGLCPTCEARLHADLDAHTPAISDVERTIENAQRGRRFQQEAA
jgi:hypothetical protein